MDILIIKSSIFPNKILKLTNLKDLKCNNLVFPMGLTLTKFMLI